MVRPDDILIPPSTPWLKDRRAQRVCAAIEAGGHRVFFVGGCVRNALLDLADGDVDLATDAHPETVMRLATDAGLKTVPTGIAHGTITVVSQGKAYEVTTFRRDVATDGRRAVVVFSEDIAEDARRRDFTMNALYATPLGRVVDPLGGVADLLARRVRFIDDPTARIREDYLRILRFFRFSAVYGRAEDGFDSDALAAIAGNLAGLETLSAERIGQEMKKLLAAPDPAPALAAMRQTGVLPVILPGATDRWIGPLVHLEAETGTERDWRTRLALLGGEGAADRLRLSRQEAWQIDLLRSKGMVGPPLGELAYRHGAQTARQVALMRGAVTDEAPDIAELNTLAMAENARFPVTAADLMPAYEGPALGRRLAELEQVWIDAGFAPDRDALLRKS